MVNSKNIVARLGIIAGLGIAMLPLTTYASDEQNDVMTVSATVGEVFELSVDSSVDLDGINVAKTINVDVNNSDMTLLHTAKVTGNLYKGYDLTMSSVSENTDLKYVKDATAAIDSADRYDTSKKIPTGTTIEAGTSAWGYKKSETSDNFSGDWATVKASESPDTLKSNANNEHTGFDDTVYISYGISTSESQAAGAYETQVSYKVTPRV